ncbi:MAG: choice-of-anchor I family protein [Phycisphaeraceae bacterium]|nr:choice-of-anchor I family protein [Phycisphaeraceae bacterium]
MSLATRVSGAALTRGFARCRSATAPCGAIAMWMIALTMLASAPASPPVGDPPPGWSKGDTARLRVVGRHSSGLFDKASSEIAAYHAPTRRLFVVNGTVGLDVLDLANPAEPVRVDAIRLRRPTSVAVHGDLVAVAAMGPAPGDRGSVNFYDPSARVLRRMVVGFGPDMICFTRDGKTLLVACEGEPSLRDREVDPPGTIAFIDLSKGVEQATVTEAGFGAFEPQRQALINRGLRVVSPGRSLAQDLEPEYIALSPNDRWAFVTLQENNAIAIVDVTERKVVSIEPLGFRDAMTPGMGLDAIADGVANPAPVPVLAMFQPDALVAFEHEGALWLATANEGEAREGTIDEAITLDQARAMASGGEAKAIPEGRLLVSSVPAPATFGGRFCAFGTRSMSLWRVDLAAIGAAPERPAIVLAWDSGEIIERMVAERTPALFNADHRRTAKVDARSLSKGPEPEGVALAEIDGRRLLIVTLERSSGVMIFDATDPAAPKFAGYANPRAAEVDLSIDLDGDGVPDHFAAAGDLGPEGVHFLPASVSPTGRPLLIVCNEVSGTTTLFEVMVE